MNYIMRTTTGRNLPFELTVHEVSYDNFKVDKCVTTELCKTCRMYGHRGGCPPVSPDFNKAFRGKTDYVYLVILSIPPFMWASNKVLSDPHPNRRFLMVSSFVEVVIKSVEKNLVKTMRAQGGRVLPSSYCTGCPTCVAVDGNPCVKPTERMFSMESTGVLVSDTCIAAGLPALDWYTRTEQVIPAKIRKVSTYMSNTPLDVQKLHSDLLQFKNLHRVERRHHAY